MIKEARAFRQTLEDPKIQNVHAIVEDIKLVANYIDAQTGDLSAIPESDLVTAIKGLTKAVNDLKTAFDAHAEEIPVAVTEE